MFEIAREYEVEVILLENVCQVVELNDDDAIKGKAGHGIHTLMLQKAGNLGFFLVRIKTVETTSKSGCARTRCARSRARRLSSNRPWSFSRRDGGPR